MEGNHAFGYTTKLTVFFDIIYTTKDESSSVVCVNSLRTRFCQTTAARIEPSE